MVEKVKYEIDSQGVKVKLTFDEKNKVWRSHSKEFDQKPIPDIRNKPEKEGGGRATHGYGKAYLKGGRVK